jgi:hypothetical protein
MDHMEIGVVPFRERECPSERRRGTGGIVEWVENQQEIHNDDPFLNFDRPSPCPMRVAISAICRNTAQRTK